MFFRYFQEEKNLNTLYKFLNDYYDNVLFKLQYFYYYNRFLENLNFFEFFCHPILRCFIADIYEKVKGLVRFVMVEWCDET